MDVLNLALVGWLFAVGSGLALGLGIWIIIGLHQSGEDVRRQLAPRAMLAVSLALFVVPLIAVCVATIVTLRGETALRVLSG